MFTECAPPDAIAQRAGRINRRRVKDDCHVHIFKASDVSRKIYDPSVEGLLERSLLAFSKAGEKISESDILQIVESVYSNNRPETSSFFIEASAKYSETQRRLMGIFDNLTGEDRTETTRKFDYLQVPVIPLVFKEEVIAMPLSKRRWYEVKMPHWYVRKHKEELGEVVFCEMGYDSKIGATFASDEGVSSLIF